MKFNLEPDRESIAHGIRNGVPKAVTPPKPITRVEFEYDLSSMDIPTIWAQFDCERNGEPGGSGEKIEFMRMELKHWTQPCHAALDGETVSVIWDKQSTEAVDEEMLCAAVGGFLVDILKSLRDEGVFNSLNRAKRCYLAVNTYDGVWGWPIYKNRGTDDLV